MTSAPQSRGSALVTGASRGSGYAIAAGLLDRGYDVWILDIDGPGVEAAVARLGAHGRARALLADVGDRESVERAFAMVDEAGDLVEVLVNNAGVMPQAPFLEVSPEEYRTVVRVNLDGVFWCSQAFARRLVDAGGRGAIVNVSSMAARIAPPRTSAYCASKGGVSSLTRAMAVDLGPHGIRVNDIAPGVIRTDMNRHLFDAAGAHEARVLGRIPGGRIGRPDDLVGVTAFLASGDADYVTGVSVPVDGGFLAR